MRLFLPFCAAVAAKDYEKISSFSCTDSDLCSLTFENGPTFTTQADDDGILYFSKLKFANSERFKAPEIVDSYGTNEIDMSDFALGAACSASEDCLYLQVWTSKEIMENKDLEKMPIVIYIHGGGFTGDGNRNYNMKNLVLNQGVVGVSIQYRLAGFGFLKMPVLEADQPGTGNWGLLDQQKAFEWVSLFGGHFGGDSDAVTLSACSAGCGSVHLHLQMESSHPYFHRVVCTSGFMSGDQTSEDANYVTELVLANAKCTDAADKAECLRDLSYSKIKTAMFQAMNHPSLFRPGMPAGSGWGPCVDEDIVKYGKAEAIATGKIKKNTPVLWIISAWDTREGRAAEGLRYTMPSIPDMADDVAVYDQLLAQGFKVPSDFSNQYFKQIYGTNIPGPQAFGQAFGCPSVNGEVQECNDQFSKWFNSNFMYCSTLNQWNQLLPNSEYGPFYPMVMDIGGGTADGCRAGHCSEKGWVMNNQKPTGCWTQATPQFADDFAHAIGSFYRTGSFDIVTIKNAGELGGNMNRITAEGVVSDAPFRKDECDVLDAIDDYFLQDMHFLKQSTTTPQTTTTTTTAEPTTTPEQTTADTRCDGLTIDALKVPQGKINPKGKWPTGGISERTFLTRYNLFNKGDGLGLWEKNYLGYVTFTKAMCGADFLNKIADGTLRLDVQDRTDCYIGVPAPALSSNGVTLQFYHSKTSLNNKQDLGSKKRDQMFLMVNGIDQVNFGKKKARTCLEKAKLFAIQDPDQIGEGKENLSRCVADHFESGR